MHVLLWLTDRHLIAESSSKTADNHSLDEDSNHSIKQNSSPTTTNLPAPEPQSPSRRRPDDDLEHHQRLRHHRPRHRHDEDYSYRQDARYDDYNQRSKHSRRRSTLLDYPGDAMPYDIPEPRHVPYVSVDPFSSSHARPQGLNVQPPYKTSYKTSREDAPFAAVDPFKPSLAQSIHNRADANPVVLSDNPTDMSYRSSSSGSPTLDYRYHRSSPNIMMYRSRSRSSSPRGRSTSRRRSTSTRSRSWSPPALHHLHYITTSRSPVRHRHYYRTPLWSPVRHRHYHRTPSWSPVRHRRYHRTLSPSPSRRRRSRFSTTPGYYPPPANSRLRSQSTPVILPSWRRIPESRSSRQAHPTNLPHVVYYSPPSIRIPSRPYDYDINPRMRRIRHGYGINTNSYVSSYTYVLAFFLDTIPRQIYLHFLLRLPYLYFSRVTRIFEEATLSMREIKNMAVESLRHGGDPVHGLTFPGREEPRSYSNLKNTWEMYIDSLLKEWKTLNIVSVLLLS